MPQHAAHRFRTLVLCLVSAPPLLAQANIDGVVRDSLSGRTLAFASVQLSRVDAPTAAGRSVMTDANGHFVIDSVSPGKYLFGFFHPRLDSLGFDAVTRPLTVTAGWQTLTQDLALPSAQTLARELCGAMDSTTGVLVGRVLRASDGETVGRGHVVVQWRELTVAKTMVADSIRVVPASITSDGRYVACRVPTDATLSVIALADSATAPVRSASITVRFAAKTPLLHQDLLLPGGAVAVTGAHALGRGTASLVGRVLQSSGSPIAGARVIVRDAAVLDSLAVTDSTGTYRFRSLRGGTYPVDVMKLGMAPTRASVNLRDARTATADFTLEPLAYELDGVRVYAAYSHEAAGFAKRRASRSKSAFFMTADEVAKEGKMLTSMVLLRAPMLGQFGSNASGRPVIAGPLGCDPLVFVDGIQESGPFKMGAPRAAAIQSAFAGTYDGQVQKVPAGGAPATQERAAGFDLDNWIRPSNIGGIEVYGPGSAPARFSDDNLRCASVVIWTKSVVR
jgi:protocatechuate 3,4-dioxygenase beta subunit